MDNINLKEQSVHGSSLFPLHVYTQDDNDASFFVPFHWHEEIEILYIEKGEITIYINDTTITGKSGEIYFINSSQIHQISSVQNTPAVHYAIVFNPSILSFEIYDYCQSYFINPIINKSLTFPHKIDIKSNIYDDVLKEYMELINAYNEKCTGWSIIVKSSLLKIVSSLVKNKSLIENSSPNSNDYKINMIKEIISFIQDNYKDKITIDILANKAGVTPQYFCKFFKSLIGKTAIEYINEYRIEKACNLLKSKDIKIIDICFSVGFENFSYFIKTFKKYKNTTPSEYKNSYFSKK